MQAPDRPEHGQAEDRLADSLCGVMRPKRPAAASGIAMHTQASTTAASISTAVVALSFMRLRAGGALTTVFAVAGVFWLRVMMGLGSMDPATRTDIPVSRIDVRPADRGMPLRLGPSIPEPPSHSYE